MKNTVITLATILVGLGSAACLVSCKNPQDTAKAVAIGQTGLDILVAKKVIKPEDAESAQKLGQILITPTPSGK
jgi:hypothetical protein